MTRTSVWAACVAATVGGVASTASFAQSATDLPVACTTIADEKSRVRCYDEHMARLGYEAGAPAAPAASASSTPAAAATATTPVALPAAAPATTPAAAPAATPAAAPAATLATQATIPAAKAPDSAPVSASASTSGSASVTASAPVSASAGAAAAPAVAASTSGATASAATPRDSAGAGSEFGLHPDAIRRKRATENPDALQEETLTARIKSVVAPAHREIRIELDNGQVWVESRRTAGLPPVAGETVTIERAAFGSYFVKRAEGPPLRMRRVK